MKAAGSATPMRPSKLPHFCFKEVGPLREMALVTWGMAKVDRPPVARVISGFSFRALLGNVPVFVEESRTNIGCLLSWATSDTLRRRGTRR